MSKALELTKIIRENKFEGVWDELESKKGFQRQSVTKYPTLTLVFMWKRNSSFHGKSLIALF